MNSSQVFNDLITKLINLCYGKMLKDAEEVARTLDKLNNLNYRTPFVNDTSVTKKALLFIHQCCTVFQTKDDLNVFKCAQLIGKLVKMQKIVVGKTTLCLAIEWCLTIVQNSANSLVVIECLKTLDILIRFHLTCIHIPGLTNIMQNICKSSLTENNNTEVVLGVVRCLEAVTRVIESSEHKDPTHFAILEQCGSIFVQNLSLYQHYDDLTLKAQIFLASLVGLEHLAEIHETYLNKNIDLILGIIQCYMSYGLKHVEPYWPDRLKPTTLVLPHSLGNVPKEVTPKSSSSKKNKCKRNRKKPENRPNNCYDDNDKKHSKDQLSWYKSDSDISDYECDKATQLGISVNKLRQTALRLLSTVIDKVDRLTLFAYWFAFIPETVSHNKHNLLWLINNEPVPRGQFLIATALCKLINKSKYYLSQAELSDHVTSFTPFSVTLGLTLLQLHTHLCFALQNRLHHLALPALLKAVTALIQATPYHQTDKNLLSKLVCNIRSFLHHQDVTLRVAALIALLAVVNIEPSLPEIKLAISRIETAENNHEKPEKKKQQTPSLDDFEYALFSSEDEEEERDTRSPPLTSMPWILSTCLRNLTVPATEVAAPIRMESLQLISALTKNYFDLIEPHLPLVREAVENGLADKFDDVAYHAGKALDTISASIKKATEINDYNTNHLTFWQSLLSGPLVSLFQTDRPSVKSTVCDCLANMAPQVFDRLPRDKQILCVTLLFAGARDTEETAKASAVRALAIYSNFPVLKTDTGFMVDVAQVVLDAFQVNDMSVRVKASWALGTLTDSLFTSKKTDESVPDEILLKMLETAIKYSLKEEKIVVNAVRALGNLLGALDESALRKFKSTAENALAVLSKICAMPVYMKAKWNMGYAFKNAFSNPGLYTVLDTEVWQATAFTQLIEMVGSCKNFKVRINAALALSSPAERGYYGRFFLPIWTGLLEALEKVYSVDSMSEYKHRDKLIEQICLCLGHLTTLLTKEDLSPVGKILQPHSDMLKTHMREVLEQTVPEKSTVLYAASNSLEKLEPNAKSEMEKWTIEYLKSTVVP